MADVTFQGAPVHTAGELPAVGSQAPDFSLASGELKDLTLADFKGRKKLLNIVPSLDTPVCAISTRRFNDVGAKAAVLIISADLPFAAGRVVQADGLEQVVTLSTLRSPEFGAAYGVGIIDSPLKGLMARAVVVLDENDQVIYTQLVSEIADEPDYAAAIAALG